MYHTHKNNTLYTTNIYYVLHSSQLVPPYPLPGPFIRPSLRPGTRPNVVIRTLHRVESLYLEHYWLHKMVIAGREAFLWL